MTNREIAAECAKAVVAAKRQAEMNVRAFTIGDATTVIAGVLDRLGVGRKERAPKTPGKLADEDWILSLEREPALAGVDIRREIGIAQLWAKERRRIATRKFLLNWLSKADRTLTVSMEGQTSKRQVVVNPYVEPPNWRPTAAKLYPGTDYFDGRDWADVALDYRKAIVNQLCQQ